MSKEIQKEIQTKLDFLLDDPNQIGEDAKKIRDKVFETIKLISDESGGPDASNGKSGKKLNPQELFKRDSYDQNDNVITLFGGSGSGKTTLLLSVCGCLLLPDKEPLSQRHPNDIVLPVVNPERFGTGDTLISWVLGLLLRYVNDQPNHFRDREINETYEVGNSKHLPKYKIDEYLEVMQHNQALFGRPWARGLVGQNISSQDFKQETTDIVNANISFQDQWKNLINTIFSANETENSPSSDRSNKLGRRPFLFIPIDDADLNPDALPGILRQFRLLSHPSVIILFSCNPKHLKVTLRVKELEANTDGFSQDSRNLRVLNLRNQDRSEIDSTLDTRISEKLTKALPKQYRIEIPYLTLKGKLEFKPINVPRDRTFLELLKKITYKNHEHYESLADLFDIGLRESTKWEYKGNILGMDCSHCYSAFRSIPETMVKALKNPKKYGVSDADNLPDVYESHKKNNPSSSKFPTRDQFYKALRDDPYWEKGYCYLPKPIKKGCCSDFSVNNEKNKENVDIVPSPFVHALPRTPRHMEQLYFIINSYVERLDRISKVVKSCKDCIGKENKCFECLAHGKNFVSSCKEAAKKLVEFCNDSPLISNEHKEYVKISQEEDFGDFLATFSTEKIGIGSRSAFPVTVDSYQSHRGANHIEINNLYRFYTNKRENKNIDNENKENSHNFILAPPNVLPKDEIDEKVTSVLTLAYELTSDVSFFRSYYENFSKSRDGAPINLYNITTQRGQSHFVGYATTPRWEKFSDYYLFQRAWNQLYDVVSLIIDKVKAQSNSVGLTQPAIKYHMLQDWILLCQLQIILCIQRNRCIPRKITEIRNNNNDTIEKFSSIIYLFTQLFELQGIERLFKEPSKDKESGDDPDKFKKEIEMYEKVKQVCDPTNPSQVSRISRRIIDQIIKKTWIGGEYQKQWDLMKQNIACGFYNLYREYMIVAMETPLPKRCIAFKEWFEYGLPILTTGLYCSEGLADWLREMWAAVLLLGDDEIPGENQTKRQCLSGRNDTCHTTIKREKQSQLKCQGCSRRVIYRVEQLLTNLDQQSSKTHATFYVDSSIKPDSSINTDQPYSKQDSTPHNTKFDLKEVYIHEDDVPVYKNIEKYWGREYDIFKNTWSNYATDLNNFLKEIRQADFGKTHDMKVFFLSNPLSVGNHIKIKSMNAQVNAKGENVDEKINELASELITLLYNNQDTKRIAVNLFPCLTSNGNT